MAFAKPSSMGPGRGPIGRYLFLLSFVDLTDEQQATIAAIVKSRRDEIGLALTAIAEKRRTLAEAVLSEYAVEERIRGVASELGKAIGDATVLAADILREVREVLTPEKLQEIEARVKQVVEDAVAFAESSPDPDPAEAVRDLYA